MSVDLRSLRPEALKAMRQGRPGARAGQPPLIRRASAEGPCVLSFAQQRLWFLAQITGASEAYHIPLGLRLVGTLDEPALGRALDRLAARHEALRTRFVARDGEPRQVIDPPEVGFALAREALAAEDPAGLAALAAAEAKAPFDLERGPLVRGRLVRLGPKDHVLLLTVHHIVFDGWSMGVLSRELGALYAAFHLGLDDPLPTLDVQYADYAAWQRLGLTAEVLAAQGAYWKQTLSGAPPLLDLPLDRRRPGRQDFSGGFVPLVLDEALTAGLRRLSQRNGVTVFMTLLAGWAVVLARLSGQDEVVIGIPTANRPRRETEALIGFFVNTLAVRVDLSGKPSAANLLKRVKVAALGAQAHQDLPFEQVVELVQPVRNSAYTPVFQAMFAWQGQGACRYELTGLQVSLLPGFAPMSPFDVTLNLWDAPDGGIAGGLDYASALFESATVERWASYLRQVMWEMSADESRPALQLQMLDADARRRLLEQWTGAED